MPGTGPELGNEEIRELFVYSYRVIYRVRDYAVLVAAVLHDKRQLDPFVERIIDDA